MLILSQKIQGTPPVDRATLTSRELDVVGLLGQGLGNNEIAGRLGVAVTTVRTHLASAYQKLGLGSRLELALFGTRTGLGPGRVP